MQDRRIQKTKLAAFSAIVELLQTKKYQNISIQDIIDKANIGRTTFYAHFSTKDDLLFAYIDELFLSFELHNKKNQIEGLLIVEGLFNHIKDNKKQLKSLVNSGIDELLFNRFKEDYCKIIEQHIKKVKGNPDIPGEIISFHIVNTFTELAKWWVKKDCPYTPKQMSEHYSKLVEPILFNVNVYDESPECVHVSVPLTHGCVNDCVHR